MKPRPRASQHQQQLFPPSSGVSLRLPVIGNQGDIRYHGSPARSILNGPATTGIPLPKLAYPGMMIEIDVFAMTEPDRGST